MKKLYALSLLAGLGLATVAGAQCTITNTTITPSGLTVNVNMTASGATFPGYAWDWGDATSPATTQSASHTYAAAGTYTICAYYVDISNTSCLDSACSPVTVAAVGITEVTVNAMDVQAVPNPFANDIHVTVNLSQAQNVEVAVFDLTGKQVAVLHSGSMAAGNNVINWKPEGLSEGVYFLQVRAGEMVTTKKLVYTQN